MRVLDLSKLKFIKESTLSNANLVWLAALVLFTPIVGAVINYDFFSARSVLLLLLWSIVLLTPYVLTRRIWLYYTATTLIFIDGFINLFHYIVLRCPLNASSIFVFMNTNINEASEFMAIKTTPLLLLLIPYTLLFILALRHKAQLSFKTKSDVIVWSVLWIFTTIFFTDNIIHKRFLRLSVPDVERAIVSFFKESKEYSNLKKRELYSLDTKLTTNDSTLLVVIIGESCNRNHMSIYGYNRNTTPRLEGWDNLFVFDNVISANSSTLKSVMNFMTESNIEHPRPIDSCIHIFDVFHSSPYKTYWLSNQSPIGLWDNGVTNLVQNADVKTFVNVTSNSSMESTQKKSLDESLFEPLEIALDDSIKHKLIFLHLLGCHTEYNKRYRGAYALFDDSGDKRTRIINTYDNAVCYNDFVVDHIFSILNSYSKSKPDIRISALYFSDHGENVYDEGDYSGHDYSSKIPNANVEIPFILWVSDSQKKYIDKHHSSLKNRIHTPYMIDDLFHTIIDMACISTSCLDKTRSFINTDFDSTRQRKLEDGNIYRK